PLYSARRPGFTVAGAKDSIRDVTAGRSSGVMRYQTQVPRRSEDSTPTSFNTLRWWEIVGWDTSASTARSQTHDSPRASVAIAESIRKRMGSESAWSVEARAAATDAPMAWVAVGAQASAVSMLMFERPSRSGRTGRC